MTVGERIKMMREKLNMSQDELAKKMGYKDRSSISKIEKSGDDKIPVNVVQKFSEILHCNPLFLMGWDDDSSPGLEDKHTEEFVTLYNKLSADQQKLIDNMLIALSSKR